VVFFKLHTAIVGPGEPIVLPVNSTEPDYEAEFAFVIGNGGFRLPQSEAMKHVYGYTIVNDVSARDVQFSSQWSCRRAFRRFARWGRRL
jgi:2-keto-4-pentenoate hydratase/2-oxohepta-3-ene-1,7-dioic acid hydratase in catechol pathway